jgi:hypothetical protein
MVRWQDVVQDGSPFLVGGAIVGGLTLLTKYVSTKWGIVVWIAPISMMISSVILFYFGGKTKAENKEIVRNMLWQSVPGMVLLVLVLVTWALALGHLDFWPAYGVMLAAYVIAAVVFFMAICPSPLPGGKCWNIGGETSDVSTSAGQKAFFHKEGVVFRDGQLVEHERRETARERAADEHSRERARAIIADEDRKDKLLSEDQGPQEDQSSKEYERFDKVLKSRPENI